ncbi:hypothetical protein SRHO_G00121980 [Serrasalmus rhombeus]
MLLYDTQEARPSLAHPQPADSPPQVVTVLVETGQRWPWFQQQAGPGGAASPHCSPWRLEVTLHQGN